VLGGYFVLSTLAYAFPHRPALWPLLAAAHLAFGGALLTGHWQTLRRWARGAPGPPARREPEEAAAAGPGRHRPGRHRRGPHRRGPLRRAVAVVADWYPLILLPFLYWELPLLNQSIWGGHYFDAMVQRWEAAVFGTQVALTFPRRFTSLLISEPLHFAYLSYYLILYVFPAVVYARRGRDAFLDTLFGMMLGFAIYYTVFILFPVKGPYFLFPPPGEPQSAGPMYQTVQFILGSGASAGTAFPSSHTALAAIQTTNARRHLPAAVPLLALGTLGIAFGAVYSGIHYAVDTAAGLATGLVVGLLVPRVRGWLR
jgi:membrane-associated phospholipid phosphatase